MRRCVARGQRYKVQVGGDREMILFRYPFSSAGTPDDAGATVEGFVRTTPNAARSNHHERQTGSPMSHLTHVDDGGKARMVDISGKRHTSRMAKASGSIVMRPDTLEAIRTNAIAKGDVLGVARVAGIMAAKRTPELIPLCHQISLAAVQIDLELDQSLPGIRVQAVVSSDGQTGVEMEAITAVSVSLITLYDMAKGVDKGMVIGQISLIEKRGGKSGDWVREG